MVRSTDVPRGYRILLTRAPEDAHQWASRLEIAGAEAVALPCIVCEPIYSAALGAQLGLAIERAEWLVLTSVRGVANVAALLGPGTELPSNTQVAAVGPATEEAARGRWGRVDLVAPDGTAASLADALIPLVTSDQHGRWATVVVTGPEHGRPDLEQRLQAAGVRTARFAVYRTVAAPAVEPREDLDKMDLDAVFLASPSAVRGLLNQASVPSDMPVISIGPSTTEAASEAGLTVTSEATTRSLEGLLNALREAVAQAESCQ